MKTIYAYLKYPVLLCGSLVAETTFSADITSNVSTEQIVNALGISASQVVSISTNGTDGTAIGVADTSTLGIIEDPKSGNKLNLLLSNSYPTEGRTFLVISTGWAESAGNANEAGNLSGSLGGLSTPGENGGEDMAQIEMILRAPDEARCASFDFSFFSDEYNEFIGSNYNDTFLIEKDASQFSINIVGGVYTVAAPNNFAFDTSGQVISVNSTFDTVCNTSVGTPENCSTGTTYDNATIKLRASTPVNGGEEVRFIISIMDLGDSLYDSTAFIDKFLWRKEDCASGAQQIDDADSDGLLDEWELNGVTVALPDGGSEFVNLPAMGADPNVKDLFIELDWMKEAGFINYQPQAEVLAKIIAAYKEIGVNVHIDAGPNSVMDPETSQTWAAAGITSKSNSIPLISILGSRSGDSYVWSAFDEIKTGNFSVARRNIFHYGVIGHRSPFDGVSAISRSLNSSDFFIPLGDFLGTVNEQAGSILKATGQNLALREGGRDNGRFKPHYLSVMNPLYSLDGVILDGVDGHMGFSNITMSPLDESKVSETTGLPNTDGLEDFDKIIGVKRFCGGEIVITEDASTSIDWNCNETLEESTSADINGSGVATDMLGSYSDLEAMRFAGGLIGESDSIIELPRETLVTEFSQDSPISSIVPSLYEVSIIMQSSKGLSGGYSQKALIRNRGTKDETFSLVATSELGWADFSALPTSYTIAAGDRVEFEFPVTIPSGTEQTDIIKLVATSNTYSSISDIATVEVTSGSATASAGAGFLTVLYEDGNPFKATGGAVDKVFFAILMLTIVGRLVGAKSRRNIWRK